MMKFEVRAPTPQDVPRVVALARETFLETFTHYSDQDLDCFLAKSFREEVTAREIQDPSFAFRIIDSGTDLLGFAKIGPVCVPIANPDPDDMELRQLYVRKRWIGRGFGQILMNWSMRQFEERQARSIYVSVYAENARAIRFYRHYGFEKVGEYGFRVGQHIDPEWIMRRSGCRESHH